MAALEDWQLLKSIHPIFASKAPFSKAQRLRQSDQDILSNLETIFDFEIWLLPDALQEALASGIAERSSEEATQVLAYILNCLEHYVDGKILHLDSSSRLSDGEVCGPNDRNYFS